MSDHPEGPVEIVIGAETMTVYGKLVAEFSDEAIPGPFLSQPFTVIFRPETKIAPLVIHGSGIDLSGDATGPTTYTVWAGGGQGRKIIGAFNASQIIGIVKGYHHMVPTAS